MKALSVRQPWAELIASGRKTIELRSWSTQYRGPLLICASGQLARDERAREWLDALGELWQGVAVCTVELVDVRLAHTRADAYDAACTPPAAHFAWVLAKPRRTSARPIKGRLGLFEVQL